MKRKRYFITSLLAPVSENERIAGHLAPMIEWSSDHKVTGNESLIKTQKVIFIYQAQALWITLEVLKLVKAIDNLVGCVKYWPTSKRSYTFTEGKGDKNIPVQTDVTQED